MGAIHVGQIEVVKKIALFLDIILCIVLGILLGFSPFFSKLGLLGTLGKMARAEMKGSVYYGMYLAAVLVGIIFISCLYDCYVRKLCKGISAGEKIVGAVGEPFGRGKCRSGVRCLVRYLLRYLLASVVNCGMCACLTIAARILLAFPGRLFYSATKLYCPPWDIFPWYLLLLLSASMSLLHHKWASHLPGRRTLGEKLFRIRLTRHKLWQSLAEGLATVYLPVVLTFNLVAGAYSGCFEADFKYIGEKRLSAEEMEGWEEDIFSEEGRKKLWGFVATEGELFNSQYPYVKYGIASNGHIKIITFGRKLERVRLLAGRDAPLNESHAIMADSRPLAFLYMGVGGEYEENAVYFYEAECPKLYRWWDDCMVQNSQGFYVVHLAWTDYESFCRWPEILDYCRIEKGGVFGQWLWSWDWVTELQLRPVW